MDFVEIRKEVKSWLVTTLEDPLVKTLAENSHLTQTQLETFLIDVLAEEIIGQPVVYEYKSRLRLIGNGVSRGAFNRTLRQAQRNVIRSIYTILLLGYLGILETPRLNRYLEISKHLEEYVKTYRKIWKPLDDGDSKEKNIKTLTFLRKKLITSLEELTMPKMLSKRESSK